MKQINFTIYNDTNSDAIFGAAYTLELLQNGNWYSVRMKGVKGDTQPTWPAIAYQLPAHGTATNTIDLSNHEGIEPGRYRLIKEVSPLMGNQKPYALAAEFTISKSGTLESATTIVTSLYESTTTKVTTKETITEITAQTTPIIIPSIQELIKRSDDVIIGTVESVVPTVRIDLVALGITKGSTGFFQNISSYIFRVDQVIMGKMTPGEQIKMDMHGGLADGVSEDFGITYPKIGAVYLMFITRREENQNKAYFRYLFVGSFEGYAEIREGKIVPRDKAQLFKPGTPIEQVLDTVKKAVNEKSRGGQ